MNKIVNLACASGAGICNRLMNLRDAFAFAHDYPETHINLWWDTTDLVNVPFDTLFRLDNTFSVDVHNTDIRSGSYLGYLSDNCIHYFCDDKHNQYQLVKSRVNPDQIRIGTVDPSVHELVVYYWQCWYNTKLKLVCLQPSLEVSDKADQLTCEYRAQEAIGLHIRATDNIDNYRKEVSIYRAECIINEGEYCLLCTDDERIQRHFSNKKNVRLVVPEGTRTSPGRPVFDVACMYMMARTRRFYGSTYSAFSHIINWLADKNGDDWLWIPQEEVHNGIWVSPHMDLPQQDRLVDIMLPDGQILTQFYNPDSYRSIRFWRYHKCG